MRRLTLVRHAHAVTAGPGQDDFFRPLSAEGRTAALALGEDFAGHFTPPQLLRVSPALRTRQTAQLACTGAFPGLAGGFAEMLYLASLATLLKEIAATPEACEHLMLVGHNPGLSELWTLLGDESDFSSLTPAGWRSRVLPFHRWAEVRHTG